MSYNPIFQVTAGIVRYLAKIEAARDVVDELSVPLDLAREFRKEASIMSTHYSTKIEGNRLTLKQTRDLIAGKNIIAREVDKREVMNYYNCLELIQRTSRARQPLTEKLIKNLHAVIQKGIVKGALRGEYRDAQNAIYDTASRKAVYFPPEAKDIRPLMKSFVSWLNLKSEIHPVLKAGIVHYQFVTIHPFMDGNGRTARALATLILHRAKYDLKQFYSLEEYYAEDLKGYYDALHKCQGFNYYDRPKPDITTWLDYFTKGAAIVFREAKDKAAALSKKTSLRRSKRDIRLLQAIGPREKRILAYFRNNLQLRTKDLCKIFRIKDRTARDLLAKLISAGIIKRRGSGKRDAYYVLSAAYRRLIGG